MFNAVAKLVEALRYKPEGRGFDSRWCHWNFSLTSFRPHYGPGSKGCRCVGLTTLPPSCADGHEIWEPQLLEPSGPVQACSGIAVPLYHDEYQTVSTLSMQSAVIGLVFFADDGDYFPT
jgi:hypothetical protein